MITKTNITSCLVDFDAAKHGKKGDRVVDFNGKEYAILGNPDTLDQIYDLFSSISFNDTDSEKDFERRIKAATNPQLHLKRRLSAPELGQKIQQKAVFTADQDKALCQEKSSTMWECIGRKPDKLSGYKYTFVLRDEFDDISPRLSMPPGSSEWSEDVLTANRAVEEAQKKLFPAAERLHRSGALRQAMFSDPEGFRLAVRTRSGFFRFSTRVWLRMEA